MDKNSLNLIVIGLGILILFSFYTSKNENWQNDDVSWSQNNKKEEIKEEVEEEVEEPKEEEIVSPPEEEIKSNVCNCGCGKEFCNCKKRKINTNCENGSCNNYEIIQPSCNSYQQFYSSPECGVSQDYGYTEININPYCNNN